MDLLAAFTKRRVVTYYNLHLAYFLLLAVLGAVILQSLPSPGPEVARVSFLNSLFGVVSALCLSGLSGVPIQDISVPGQLLLFFMMILGGQLVTSLVPLLVKKRRYYKIARQLVKLEQLEKAWFDEDMVILRSRGTAIGPHSDGSSLLWDDTWMEGVVSKLASDDGYKPLSPHRRCQLKEILNDYHAVSLLFRIVVVYYGLVHLAGFAIAWLSITHSSHSSEVLRDKDVRAPYFAIFAIVSAFANCGYLLTNENLVPFNANLVLQIDLIAMILLGNTLFPVAIRGILTILDYGCSKSAAGPNKIEVYEHILNNSRRHYPHLFGPSATTWLLVSSAALNFLGTSIFCVLDWNSAPTRSLTAIQRVVNGLFLSVNTRMGGMNSINLIELSPVVLLAYCIMMYLAAYPIRSYKTGNDDSETTIKVQARRWLLKDSTYLFFASLIICSVENWNLKHDPLNFNVLSIVFEVLSAYGNVGLTLGYSCSRRIHVQGSSCADEGISFSGRFGVVGKLVIMYVMLLGRHRGLASNIEPSTSDLIDPESFSKPEMRGGQKENLEWEL